MCKPTDKQDRSDAVRSGFAAWDLHWEHFCSYKLLNVVGSSPTLLARVIRSVGRSSGLSFIEQMHVSLSLHGECKYTAQDTRLGDQHGLGLQTYLDGSQPVRVLTHNGHSPLYT